MTRPMANTAFDITRLWNIQDGTTDSAEFDVIDSNTLFLKVLHEFGHCSDWICGFEENDKSTGDFRKHPK